jgi:hypothetical protein
VVRVVLCRSRHRLRSEIGYRQTISEMPLLRHSHQMRGLMNLNKKFDVHMIERSVLFHGI